MLRVLKDQQSIQNPEHELYQDWIWDENHNKYLSHVQTVYTFLEQTSWNNFNEGGDLQAPVEDYARKFGCYHSAVLADRIYQTRSNKLFCFQHGIRLSGPPLGRRKAFLADTTVKRQLYKDSCGRNAIESRSGNSKRRFGLDCIFPRWMKPLKLKRLSSS